MPHLFVVGGATGFHKTLFSLTAVRCKGSSRGKKGILVSTGGSGSLPRSCRGGGPDAVF